jgi:hypothetical protein
MLGRPTLAAVILAASASGAWGLEAMLGDVFVTLPPSAGFCELTPRYEFDGRMVAFMSKALQKSGNKLLAMSADCDQLAEARVGRRRSLDDVVAYQTVIAAVDKPPTASVARICTLLRTQGNADLAGEWPDFKARLDGIVEGIKRNERKILGVLAEDANVCYGG